MVAENDYTAFISRRQAEHVTARLIVRRVKRLNPRPGAVSRADCWIPTAAMRYSPTRRLGCWRREASHRDHATIDQIVADLKAGPLAHCPSGVFTAKSAWTVLAAIALNLTRAAGLLASRFHARARAATIRAQLIAVPARTANRARSWRLHLPRNWPWQTAWETMFDTTASDLLTT